MVPQWLYPEPQPLSGFSPSGVPGDRCFAAGAEVKATLHGAGKGHVNCVTALRKRPRNRPRNIPGELPSEGYHPDTPLSSDCCHGPLSPIPGLISCHSGPRQGTSLIRPAAPAHCPASTIPRPPAPPLPCSLAPLLLTPLLPASVNSSNFMFFPTPPMRPVMAWQFTFASRGEAG